MMSDTPKDPTWILASDGNWYPPEEISASGWEQRDDGKWYEAEGDPSPPTANSVDEDSATQDAVVDEDSATQDAVVVESGYVPAVTTAVDGASPERSRSGVVAFAGRLGWPFLVATTAALVLLVVLVVTLASSESTKSDLQAEVDDLTAARDDALARVEAAEQTAEERVAAAQERADRTIDEAQDELDERSRRLDDREAAIEDLEAELESQAAYLDELIGHAEASQFSDGIYLVGSDIQPGRYRNQGGGFCYWARLSGVTGDFNDIIANSNVSGPTVVDISSTDVAFESDGCGTWTKIG